MQVVRYLRGRIRAILLIGSQCDDPLARFAAAPERLIRRFHDQASEEAAGQGRDPDRPP